MMLFKFSVSVPTLVQGQTVPHQSRIRVPNGQVQYRCQACYRIDHAKWINKTDRARIQKGAPQRHVVYNITNNNTGQALWSQEEPI